MPVPEFSAQVFCNASVTPTPIKIFKDIQNAPAFWMIEAIKRVHPLKKAF